jgi:hypothetical protein
MKERDNPVPTMILWQIRDDWANFKGPVEQFVSDVKADVKRDQG